MITEPPPRGFELGTTADGDCCVRLRTTGAMGLGCFFVAWLSLWTTGCVFGTYEILVGQLDGLILAFMILWLIPGWFFEIAIGAYALWFLFSVTTFTFCSDRLIVERALWGYKRQRMFPQSEIRAVVQVKDGGEGEDSFPGWGLVIVSSVRVKVISRQPIDKSGWLGPHIASWAGVAFEPWVPPKRDETESL